MCFPALVGAPAVLAGAGGVSTGLGFGASLGAASAFSGAVIAPATAGLIGVGGSVGLGGTLFSALSSPIFSIATSVIGFGVQAIGASQQASFEQQKIDFQQAQLRNRQIAAEQDIKARQERLQVQKGIIGDQGAQARGQLRTEQAGRGVLVDVGSAADQTEQLAGDVAFAKLVKEHETALQDRQDRIVASGLAADSALLDFQSADSSRASVFGQVGGAFKLAQGFSKFRVNNDGELAFRT